MPLGSLLFVLVVSFFLFRVLPGDPARTLGRGRFKTPEQLEAFRPSTASTSRCPSSSSPTCKNTFTGDLGDLAALPGAGQPT